jgi:hypothetical protein
MSGLVNSIKCKQCLVINETIFGISYDWYVSKIHSLWNDLLLKKYIYKTLVVKEYRDVGREIIEFDFYFIALHLLTDITVVICSLNRSLFIIFPHEGCFDLIISTYLSKSTLSIKYLEFLKIVHWALMKDYICG